MYLCQIFTANHRRKRWHTNIRRFQSVLSLLLFWHIPINFWHVWRNFPPSPLNQLMRHSNQPKSLPSPHFSGASFNFITNTFKVFITFSAFRCIIAPLLKVASCTRQLVSHYLFYWHRLFIVIHWSRSRHIRSRRQWMTQKYQTLGDFWCTCIK